MYIFGFSSLDKYKYSLFIIMYRFYKIMKIYNEKYREILENLNIAKYLEISNRYL